MGESWDGNISVSDIGEVQIPLLVVGTKADVMSERSIPTHMRRSRDAVICKYHDLDVQV